MCEYTHIDTNTNTHEVKLCQFWEKLQTRKWTLCQHCEDWFVWLLVWRILSFLWEFACEKNSSSFQEFFIISHSRSLFSFQSYEFSLFVVDLPRAEDPALSTDKAGRIVSELHYKNFLLGAWNAFDTCNSISLYTWKSGINGFAI